MVDVHGADHVPTVRQITHCVARNWQYEPSHIQQEGLGKKYPRNFHLALAEDTFYDSRPSKTSPEVSRNYWSYSARCLGL